MRVVFITHYTALMGANRSLLHLVKGLQKWHGVAPLVLCPQEGPFTQALEDQHIPFAVFPFANWAYTIRSRSLYSFPWLWKTSNDLVLPVLLEQVERFRPDIIHSNSQAVSLGWQLSEALGLPHVWHIREYGWKDYQLVFPLGNALKLEKLNRANHLICISEAIKTQMDGVSVPKSVVFNGIGPLAQLEKRAEKDVDQHGAHFSFLIIGLLQPGKGQHEALRAFADVYRSQPQSRLVIAGTGQRLYTLRLKMMAWLLGVSKAVEFTGYIPDPSSLYATSDAVLMCSRNEAMGRVTAEAMSYGKPVVAFNGGATPELIRSGKNGLLYNDEMELASAMKSLIADRAKAHFLGKQAQRDAIGRFSDEAYVAACFEIFQKVRRK